VCCGGGWCERSGEEVVLVALVDIVSQQQYLRACHHRCHQEGEHGGREGGGGTQYCACVHVCCGGRKVGWQHGSLSPSVVVPRLRGGDGGGRVIGVSLDAQQWWSQVLLTLSCRWPVL